MPFGFGDVLDQVRATVRAPLMNARAAAAMDDRVWKRITSQQLGVSAADPDGHKMGMNIAFRNGDGLNWYPADGYKQTLVGTVDRYEFWNPSDSGDEADWNIYIKPDPPFAYLIEDVLTNADLSVVHKGTTTSGYVIEAEVTPDEHFYNNPYFNSNGTSNRVGRKIGVYGPWVMEEEHGWRPEIHPSEILWWRDVGAGSTARTTWTIAVMQDDSNRFDLERNYRGRIDRPWSAVPRRAVIDIAVAIDPARPKTLQVRVAGAKLGAASRRRRSGGFHPVPDRLLLAVGQVVAERIAEPKEAGGHPVEAARQGPVLEHAEQQGFLLDRQCYGSRGAGILECLGDLFGAFGPAQLLEQNVAAGPREPDVVAAAASVGRDPDVFESSAHGREAIRPRRRDSGRVSQPERNWAQRLADVARGFHRCLIGSSRRDRLPSISACHRRRCSVGIEPASSWGSGRRRTC